MRWWRELRAQHSSAGSSLRAAAGHVSGSCLCVPRQWQCQQRVMPVTSLFLACHHRHGPSAAGDRVVPGSTACAITLSPGSRTRMGKKPCEICLCPCTMEGSTHEFLQHWHPLWCSVVAVRRCRVCAGSCRLWTRGAMGTLVQALTRGKRGVTSLVMIFSPSEFVRPVL